MIPGERLLSLLVDTLRTFLSWGWSRQPHLGHLGETREWRTLRTMAHIGVFWSCINGWSEWLLFSTGFFLAVYLEACRQKDSGWTFWLITCIYLENLILSSLILPYYSDLDEKKKNYEKKTVIEHIIHDRNCSMDFTCINLFNLYRC